MRGRLPPAVRGDGHCNDLSCWAQPECHDRPRTHVLFSVVACLRTTHLPCPSSIESATPSLPPPLASSSFLSNCRVACIWQSRNAILRDMNRKKKGDTPLTVADLASMPMRLPPCRLVCLARSLSALVCSHDHYVSYRTRGGGAYHATLLSAAQAV